MAKFQTKFAVEVLRLRLFNWTLSREHTFISSYPIQQWVSPALFFIGLLMHFSQGFQKLFEICDVSLDRFSRHAFIINNTKKCDSLLIYFKTIHHPCMFHNYTSKLKP
uniref:Uncharacterized protein n=1 Tax=Cacopsylla melanoneura TaxID=428564 RepID=A0A8D9EMY4_9HEMI